MQSADQLSLLYGALAHPVRRAILEQLSHGEARVGDIITRFDMTAPAITNHLRVLAKAGLIGRRAEAQTRILTLMPETLGKGEAWIADMRLFWRQSFDRPGARLDAVKPASKRKAKRQAR